MTTSNSIKPPGLPTPQPPSGAPLSGSKPAPPQPSRPPAPNRFGGRMDSRAEYLIVSAGEVAVSFDLNDISGSLFGEADAPLTTEAVVALLEGDRALVERLKPMLDEAWAGYAFKGAALVYTWRDELRHALNGRLLALKREPVYLRATDPLLILNVLARSRASLLLSNAPLALERVFLNRVLISDDAQLTRLARTVGCREEPIFEPAPQPEQDDLDVDDKT